MIHGVNLLKKIKGRLVARKPYSLLRTKEWHIERRSGKNIIEGTAIGFSYTPKDRLLIPGMLRSFDFIEYVVSYYDDTKNPSFKYNEAERHKSIVKRARLAGAKYFWGVGPKRRLSKETIQAVRNNMHLVRDGNVLMTNYRFFWGRDLRNLHTSGHWGGRKTSAFFPILKTNRYGRKPLHHRWRPKNLPKVHLDINQYYIGRHTKDIIKKKFAFYKARDYKTNFWQKASFDDIMPGPIETEPVSENIRGIGYREKRFKG